MGGSLVRGHRAIRDLIIYSNTVINRREARRHGHIARGHVESIARDAYRFLAACPCVSQAAQFVARCRGHGQGDSLADVGGSLVRGHRAIRDIIIYSNIVINGRLDVGAILDNGNPLVARQPIAGVPIAVGKGAVIGHVRSIILVYGGLRIDNGSKLRAIRDVQCSQSVVSLAVQLLQICAAADIQIGNLVVDAIQARERSHAGDIQHGNFIVFTDQILKI